MPTFDQHIKINAPVEKIWAILTDSTTWEQWFPNMEHITNLSAVAADTSFQWQHGNDSGTATITTVDQERGLLRVVTTHDGRKTTHTFELDQAGGFLGIGGDDTRLNYQREYQAAGGFIGEFITGGNPVDALQVKHTLERLKSLAEG